MRRLILVSALVFAGCQHAQKAEREDPEAAPRRDAGEQQKKAPEKKQPAPPKEKKPEEIEETKHQVSPGEGRPLLSADAEGLMKPEGPRLIQQALAKKGYLPREYASGELDLETATALRRFQQDERSPRTGYPDRETVRKLGLEVDQVFKSTGARDANPDR